MKDKNIRADIVSYLEKEILRRCKCKDNYFGEGVYHHITAVVNNAEQTADRYGADKEIVIIGAWLHDIASITDYKLYREHHIYGQYIAENILKQFDYEQDKIELVKKCILHHRGGVLMQKDTPEEICVSDADAVSHFDNIPSLLYLAYVTKGMGIEEGAAFIREKLRRSWGKLSVLGKELNYNKYQEAMRILS